MYQEPALRSLADGMTGQQVMGQVQEVRAGWDVSATWSLLRSQAGFTWMDMETVSAFPSNKAGLLAVI